jgi:hypothetical protein
MTTAAVKAAAITFKIFFFTNHPVLGLRSEPFNMAKTDPRVTRFTDGVDSRQSQVGPYISRMLWRMRSRGRPINAPAAFIHPCQPIIAKKSPIGRLGARNEAPD